ncbi:hypothetical protein QMS90_06450, partial [Cronobacter sakazakii]
RLVKKPPVNHPKKYPRLTLRFPGSAVLFTPLPPEQQRDVIPRTFPESLKVQPFVPGGRAVEKKKNRQHRLAVFLSLCLIG